MVGSSPQAASCPLTHSIHACMVGHAEGHCFCSRHTQLWFGFAEFLTDGNSIDVEAGQSFYCPAVPFFRDGSRFFLSCQSRSWWCRTKNVSLLLESHQIMWACLSWWQVSAGLLNFRVLVPCELSAELTHLIHLCLFPLCLHIHKKWTISWGAGF